MRENERNPWLNVPSQSDYVLPCDEDKITKYNEKLPPDHRLELKALPEPYFGDISAPVVLLALNPGFTDKDLEIHARPDFQALLRSNYAQEPVDFPFYYLNPCMQDSGGARWWREKLKSLIAMFPPKQLAQSLLCVEYFPYHSAHFRHARLDLPSQNYGFTLVRSAIRRGAAIVIMRSRQLWSAKVPELEKYRRVFLLKNPRNVVVSPNNCAGFDDVVSAIRNRCSPT